jgi:hypothetical protein
MTQILMETLGIYKENYLQCIGQEKFKKIETPVALLEEWSDINNRLARFAIQHRDEEGRLEAPTSLKDLVAGVEARRSRYSKTVLTSEGPRHRDLPSTPAYSSKPRYPDREQARTATSGYSNRNSNSQAVSRRPFVARHSQVEDYDEYSLMDENESDKTIDCVNPMLHPERYQKPLSPIDDDDEYEDNWISDGETDGNLDVLGQPRFPTSVISKPKTLFNEKARPADPTRPCYRHFQKRCTDGDKCGWSHKLVDMQKLAQDKVDELFNSNFVPSELIQSRLNQRRSDSSSNRNASLTRQYGTQELTESSESESIQIGNHSNSNQVQFESGESRSNASQNS